MPARRCCHNRRGATPPPPLNGLGWGRRGAGGPRRHPGRGGAAGTRRASRLRLRAFLSAPPPAGFAEGKGARRAGVSLWAGRRGVWRACAPGGGALQAPPPLPPPCKGAAARSCGGLRSRAWGWSARVEAGAGGWVGGRPPARLLAPSRVSVGRWRAGRQACSGRPRRRPRLAAASRPTRFPFLLRRCGSVRARGPPLLTGDR